MPPDRFHMLLAEHGAAEGVSQARRRFVNELKVDDETTVDPDSTAENVSGLGSGGEVRDAH
jgi:hypothetical protein